MWALSFLKDKSELRKKKKKWGYEIRFEVGEKKKKMLPNLQYTALAIDILD